MTFQKNQKKFQSIVSCILFALGFMFLAPRAAHAVTPDEQQCIVDRDTCQKDLAKCTTLKDSLNTSYEQMSEVCKNEFKAKPAAPKPAAKKLVTPPKPPKVTLVICEGSATKSANGKYCECAEGVPARLVSDKDVPGVKHAVCVNTVEENRQKLAEVDRRQGAVCLPGDAELGRPPDLQASCDRTGEEIKDLILEYRSLVRSFNPATWDRFTKKVDAVEGRVTALEGRVRFSKTVCVRRSRGATPCRSVARPRARPT